MPGQYPGQSGGYPPPPTYPAYPAPGYPPYAGYPAYPGGDYNQPRGYSGFAIASFVIGLVVPLVGLLLAVPFGIVGIVKTANRRMRGRWMAITGIVLSVAWWVGIVAIGIWVTAHEAHRDASGHIDQAGTLAFKDVRRGDCLSIDGLASGTSFKHLRGIPCDALHNAQTIGVLQESQTEGYPGSEALAQKARSGCSEVFQSYSGPGLVPYYLYPTEDLWDTAGAHRILCLVVHPGGQEWTGSILP
jgi:hypothetical protein